MPSSSASSTTTATRSASSCPSAPGPCSTATSPTWRPGRGTDCGFTVRTTRAPGHRCDPSKLLIDPYARAIDGYDRLGPGGVRLRLRRSGRAQPGRQRRVRPQERRRQPVLRLGRRHRAAPPVGRHGDLRGPRQGRDDDPPGRARGPARHVRGHRRPGVRRSPHRARRHRAGAAAGAPLRPRAAPARPWAAQLLGLPHHRLLRARTTPTPPAARTASRCTSSSRW